MRRSLPLLVSYLLTLLLGAQGVTRPELLHRRGQEEVDQDEVVQEEEDEVEKVLDPGSLVWELPDDWDPQIRGGEPVEIPIPYLGLDDDFFLCQVILVHADIVITTAACITDPFLFGGRFPSAVRIGSLEPAGGGTVVPVGGGQIHPDFDQERPWLGHDIAVLKLNSSLTNTVALMNEDPMKPQTDFDVLFVAGFGQVDNVNYPDPDVLQGLFYFNVENCFNRFAFYRPEFHICGDANPEQATCFGDFGAPAVEPGTRVVLGLSSSFTNPGQGNCEDQTVDVYTRMSTYTPWVRSMICEMSANPPGFCVEDKTNDCLFGWFFNFLDSLRGPYQPGKGW
ncbi:Tryp_SPc [Seminavis robusta]|uniref:Tryp_SPc n=1 Tax=Seminavis robusta TaxID=568900 RepID=A0A9N8HWL8_9STRA|nr:Tryp_SPc [Seminavis robusta]|eukprot:Sro2247_g320630.1 Tryp_SPc (338) ;mRNA; f:7060-8073